MLFNISTAPPPCLPAPEPCCTETRVLTVDAVFPARAIHLARLVHAQEELGGGVEPTPPHVSLQVVVAAGVPVQAPGAVGPLLHPRGLRAGNSPARAPPQGRAGGQEEGAARQAQGRGTGAGRGSRGRSSSRKRSGGGWHPFPHGQTAETAPTREQGILRLKLGQLGMRGTDWIWFPTILTNEN